jgi:hypothetical protein
MKKFLLVLLLILTFAIPNARADAPIYGQYSLFNANDGNVNRPTYSFILDTNTGFYRSGADEMSLSLGGAQKYIWSTTKFTAPSGIFTNLTDGYIPYHISDASGLGNSSVYNLSAGTVVFYDATLAQGIEFISQVSGQHIRSTAGTLYVNYTKGTNLAFYGGGTALLWNLRADGYTNWPGQARVSAQFDKTSDTTLANITGLSVDVTAGQTYSFRAVLPTTSNVAGGIKVAISGTATATAIWYEGLITNAGLTTQGRSAALDGAIGVTAVTAAMVVIEGTITVNAGGTLTVQFAQNASNGAASSVLVGGTFTVQNIQ